MSSSGKQEVYKQFFSQLSSAEFQVRYQTIAFPCLKEMPPILSSRPPFLSCEAAFCLQEGLLFQMKHQIFISTIRWMLHQHVSFSLEIAGLTMLMVKPELIYPVNSCGSHHRFMGKLRLFCYLSEHSFIEDVPSTNFQQIFTFSMFAFLRVHNEI